ncbi:MAG: hypothetical protein NXI16_07620 [Alphaproteobacteria bacterium]|nr:hypothetical protein [Alphaproteobacteria bacterium]
MPVIGPTPPFDVTIFQRIQAQANVPQGPNEQSVTSLLSARRNPSPPPSTPGFSVPQVQVAGDRSFNNGNGTILDQIV